ncbi:MAG: hypothetical protein CMJ39_02645 [Phycisphaerae bacterium]|nr:hypothetical protein [Phycisphaerae bacterium]
MLHDQPMTRMSSTNSVDDRRTTSREPAESELFISWHHHPSQAVRYRLINESSGGCLIQSSVPLIEGMTGTVTGRLPGDTTRACTTASVLVAWTRHTSGAWHIGLRYFGVK